MNRVGSIAIRWRPPGEQRASTVLLQAASPHAVSNQVALVFGHRSADLQEQLIVWILAHRSLDKLDLAAALFQLLNQEHLVDILASEAIWSSHQDAIKVRLGRVFT
jgi:hypothetical protein